MSNSPEKIVILDYAEKKVFILDYDSNIFHNVEDFFLSEEVIENNLFINNCDYMIIPSDELSINFSL